MPQTDQPLTDQPLTYADARRYLEQFVPTPGHFTPPHVAHARTVALMAALDNPQEARPVIHLAGTSGKGSTATILESILRAHGLRTGLGLSPHVRSLTERIQLDGAPVQSAAFAAGIATMQPAIEEVTQATGSAPSFFEITIALSYMLFAGRIEGRTESVAPVDVVIMETGLGGRYDATNVVTRSDKLALLTPIGWDHTEILGDSLSEIAHAKAGIIHPGNQVISVTQMAAATEVIQQVSDARDAHLTWYEPGESLDNIRATLTHVTFDFKWPQGEIWHELTVSLGGAHQAANAGLALLAAQQMLAQLDCPLDQESIRAALQTLSLPGRMDLHHIDLSHIKEIPILLDGAHNPQKIDALLKALTAAYPTTQFCFIIGFKAGKAIDPMLERLLPYAAHLIVTSYDNQDQGMDVTAVPAPTIAERLDAQGYHDAEIATSPADALHRALDWTAQFPQPLPKSTPKPLPIIITGSFYLLAETYAALEAIDAIDAIDNHG